MSDSKWKYNIIYNMEIEVLTGLHIGGSNEELKIGGTDSPVITTKYLINNVEPCDLPYIPGSSIKGKIRSLLENVDYKGKNGDDIVSKMFGYYPNAGEGIKRLTRLIIRDAFLDDGHIKSAEDARNVIEIKSENKIDPIESKATPRFIERVRRGTKFKGKIILSIYEGDNEEEMIKCLKTGISLLEDSYLGGNGTRGYGSVKITLGEPIKKGIDKYEENIKDNTSNGSEN
ncbi:hypothetical protein [Thermoplasma volcanium GSS1]|uniref:CRISPR system Cms endoribonuclease Csm3 n=1 Tax=Thermoplasma volcanium (strain ATCC 51530 / DSM 4299 / JCM 9571 / NBRC 15438 / GSS1) TaxID=273116 RepID=Q97CJ2_THEVO|nr:type III-A CRISPR-associated RAMP protein Csm3 [Thermoplasma volcanium]BAB59251.1 hypothetical protein [Thermoplasma volcanium GSS1]